MSCKLARPGQLLIDHLKGVENIMVNSPSLVEKEILAITGKNHDIGKYTTYFQDKLEGRFNSYSSHSDISALITYLQLKEKLSSQELFCIYLAIKYHHSLPNILNFNHRFDILCEQASNLKQEINYINHPDKKSLSNIFQQIQSIKDINYSDLKQLKEARQGFIRNSQDIKWYFYFLNLFSNLVYADKADSANIKRTFQPLTTTIKDIDNYIIQKHGQPSSAKEEIKNEILQTLKNAPHLEETYIFTLTAPTGAGKTLSSLQAALHIKEQCGSSKIIYAVPYINIIEQSKDDYKNIFGQDVFCHYSISGIEDYKDTDLNIDQALIEIESWENNIILTTFVQLFHTIISPRNRTAKKIKNLYNSIIILDEIQAVPENYKALIGAMIFYMAKYYKTRFILMTATQPEILEYANKAEFIQEDVNILTLLPNYKTYFTNQKARTRLIYHPSKITTDELCDHIIKNHPDKQQSVLIVVNTIKRSKEIYNNLKDIYSNIYYLSTSLYPEHRRAVIKKVKKLIEAGKSVVLVTTQSIEAGVDLDFDIGYRDLAPWESLVQVAGRVNRKGSKPISDVHIIRIKDGDKEDWKYIYPGYGIQYVMEIFDDYSNIINEPDYQEITELYYEKMLSQSPRDEEVIILKHIKSMNFEALKDFSLIKELPKKDVLIETPRSVKLLKAYIEILKNNPNINLLSVALQQPIKIDIDNLFEKNVVKKLIFQELSHYITQTYQDNLDPISKYYPFLNFLDLFWIDAQAYHPDLGV